MLMMCKHPFVRERPYPGWSSRDVDARLAATPLPCGRCLPCRINKRRMWTFRILLEASLYEENLFCTFTYNDDHYPSDGFVNPTEFKNLIQRIRRRLPNEFRYFGVGEYGDRSWRAHYHCILFNVGESQKRIIDSAWNNLKTGRGFTYIVPVNPKIAQYICGYTIKKLTKAEDPQLSGRKPEFMRSSRKGGGIGSGAIKKIAEKLKAVPYFKPQIITELKYGNKSYPLGAYLTKLLADELGVSEDEKQQHLWKYQEGILEKHFDINGLYEMNIINEKAQHRLMQSKRAKIFSSRRSI